MSQQFHTSSSWTGLMVLFWCWARALSLSIYLYLSRSLWLSLSLPLSPSLSLSLSLLSIPLSSPSLSTFLLSPYFSFPIALTLFSLFLSIVLCFSPLPPFLYHFLYFKLKNTGKHTPDDHQIWQSQIKPDILCY